LPALGLPKIFTKPDFILHKSTQIKKASN